MQELQKELTNIQALFPQVELDAIRKYMRKIPDAADHLRVPLTLKYFFKKEERENLLKLREENQQYAKLIHDLFPIYGVHKIMKKLTKYGNIPDRCKLVIKHILKSKENELDMHTFDTSQNFGSEEENQYVTSDQLHQLHIAEEPNNGSSQCRLIDEYQEEEDDDQFDLIEFLAEKTSKSRQHIANYCLAEGIDTVRKPPEPELALLVEYFLDHKKSGETYYEQFDLIEFLAEKTSKSRRHIANYCLAEGIDAFRKPPDPELALLVEYFLDHAKSDDTCPETESVGDKSNHKLEESLETIIVSPADFCLDQEPSTSKDFEPVYNSEEDWLHKIKINLHIETQEEETAAWEDELPQLSLNESVSELVQNSVDLANNPSAESVPATDIDFNVENTDRFEVGRGLNDLFQIESPVSDSSGAISSSVKIEPVEEIPKAETVSNPAQTQSNTEEAAPVTPSTSKGIRPETSSYEPALKKRKKDDKMNGAPGDEYWDLVEYVAEITSKPRRSIAEYCIAKGIMLHRKPHANVLSSLINHFIRDESSDDESNLDFEDALNDVIIVDGGGQRELDDDDSSDYDSDIALAMRVETNRTPPIETGVQVIPGADSVKSNGNNKEYSKIISRLMEIFPDAEPGYIRKLYNDTPMKHVNESVMIDALIERMLQADNYPKRPQREPTPEEVDTDEQISFIKELLPDADPDFLRMKVLELTAEQLKTFVTEALETKNYPTIKESLRNQQLSAQMRQYTTEFSVENFVKLVPNPAETFGDPKRLITLAREDTDYVTLFFKNKFNRYYVKTIEHELVKHRFQPYKVFKAFKASTQKLKLKNQRTKVDFRIVCKNIPLLQELAFIEHEKEVIDYVTQLKEKEEQERLHAKNAGLMLTCNCCYDDEIMPKDSHTCSNNCVFCKQCINKSTEVAFGEGKLEFPCLGDCGSSFSLETLKQVLPPNLFSKIAQKKAVAEVKAAGIENLEFCPFCDFATIPHGPPETYRIFTCQNPDCLKESCRLCKEASHVPLRCEEVEKDEDVKKRVFIENKMTEALLRKCWKCGISFYKEEGCNKMTCSCGAHMCYLCGKPVTDYKHFNGIGGDKFNLCPLYSDTLAINQQNVLKGAQAAKDEMGVASTSDLKIDPTADVEKHFKDRAKKLPREPHMEFLNRVHRGPVQRPNAVPHQHGNHLVIPGVVQHVHNRHFHHAIRPPRHLHHPHRQCNGRCRHHQHHP